MPTGYPFVMNSMMNSSIVIEEVPMTPEMAIRFEKADRNLMWLSENVEKLEIYKRHRGKYVAAAGGELFVANTAEEVRRLAREKYPDDLPHVRYIPVKKMSRIYACKWEMAAM